MGWTKKDVVRFDPIAGQDTLMPSHTHFGKFCKIHFFVAVRVKMREEPAPVSVGLRFRVGKARVVDAVYGLAVDHKHPSPQIEHTHTRSPSWQLPLDDAGVGADAVDAQCLLHLLLTACVPSGVRVRVGPSHSQKPLRRPQVTDLGVTP